MITQTAIETTASTQQFYLNGNGIVNDEPETINKIPGNRAVWVGIFAEMTEFALFFLVYFIAKAHYPEEFNQGPLKLNTLAGMLNTFALISSSYFVAKALAAIGLITQRKASLGYGAQYFAEASI